MNDFLRDAAGALSIITIILLAAFLLIRTITSFAYGEKMDQVCFEVMNRRLIVIKESKWSKGDRYCYYWLDWPEQNYIDSKWKKEK